jgi:hypothetical protein
VGICYATGATGTYLEYIGNVFLIPTVPFHNPFTSNGSSHNAKRSGKSIFYAGHFHLDPIKYPSHQCKFLDRSHKMIWIKVYEKDFDKFKMVKKFKTTSFTPLIGPRHSKVELTDYTNEIINDFCENPYSVGEEEKWLTDKSFFIFNWRHFFSQDTFFAELEKLCYFCNIKFEPTEQLVSIHKEFLDRHSYVQFK